MCGIAKRCDLFPACAGVILFFYNGSKPTFAFPRVCGGDPDAWSSYEIQNNFSPRVRG